MKTLKYLIITFILTFTISLVSCTTPKDYDSVSLIAPTGAPTLAIGQALNSTDYIEENIVAGADALAAAFTNANYDIIVAPVNLGGKLYNALGNFSYQFYQTIIWGNYYLASGEEIESFESLEGKTLLVFGKNSTPDVVVRTLIAARNINVELKYVEDVATANSYLMSGKADIIVSAEPALTKISASKTIYTLDLQKEWEKLTGNYSFPQAGIFVNKESSQRENVQAALKALEKSVHLAYYAPESVVKGAMNVDSSLAKIGEEVLNKAILKCNIKLDDNQQNAINFYFQKVIDLGLGATVGGKLPDEGFYYQA